jgi:hypothetical protein
VKRRRTAEALSNRRATSIERRGHRCRM